VLVDANLDRPVLHERLGRQRSPGLTDVLIGKTDLPSALATVSVGSTELSLLPAGTPTPGVAELLSRPLTAEVISALAEAYDAVIIDAGPVADAPDTVVLSAHPEVDTVLVVGHRQRRQRVDQTVQRLRRAGGHVLGVTVNTG
jgi:Mrp family chromosome partitioning ATPase